MGGGIGIGIGFWIGFERGVWLVLVRGLGGIGDVGCLNEASCLSRCVRDDSE